MNSYKLRVLFVIGGNSDRNDGKAPLYCRLTFNKKRKQFATGLFINPEYWNNKSQHEGKNEKKWKEIFLLKMN
ncbi:MAG: Arm DNA-binding domain-containing protein [Lutibacter sp.]|nr:Arm DNA-binding domain-containing protein [Lutibacter sp.]